MPGGSVFAAYKRVDADGKTRRLYYTAPFAAVQAFLRFCIKGGSVLIIVKTVRSGSMTRWEKVLIVLTFIAAKVIGLTTDRYGWNSFTHSLWVELTR